MRMVTIRWGLMEGKVQSKVLRSVSLVPNEAGLQATLREGTFGL